MGENEAIIIFRVSLNVYLYECMFSLSLSLIEMQALKVQITTYATFARSHFIYGG